jgi:hypothetical protein
MNESSRDELARVQHQHQQPHDVAEEKNAPGLERGLNNEQWICFGKDCAGADLLFDNTNTNQDDLLIRRASSTSTTSSQQPNQAPLFEQRQLHHVSFSDHVQVHSFPKVDKELHEDCFYSQNELDDIQFEKLMEEQEMLFGF